MLKTEPADTDEVISGKKKDMTSSAIKVQTNQLMSKSRFSNKSKQTSRKNINLPNSKLSYDIGFSIQKNMLLKQNKPDPKTAPSNKYMNKSMEVDRNYHTEVKKKNVKIQDADDNPNQDSIVNTRRSINSREKAKSSSKNRRSSIHSSVGTTRKAAIAKKKKNFANLNNEYKEDSKDTHNMPNQNNRKSLQKGKTMYTDNYDEDDIEKPNYKLYLQPLKEKLFLLGVEYDQFEFNYESILQDLYNKLMMIYKFAVKINNAISVNVSSNIYHDTIEQIQAADDLAAPYQMIKLYCFYLILQEEMNNLDEMVVIGKKLNTLGIKLKDLNAVLLSNETLGRACQKLMQYDKCLIHFRIMLKTAIALGEYDKEMDAYDQIGMTFYYLNDMEKASFFHRKSVRGEYEKSTSPYRVHKDFNVNDINQLSSDNLLEIVGVNLDDYEYSKPNPVIRERVTELNKTVFKDNPQIYMDVKERNSEMYRLKRFNRAKEVKLENKVMLNSKQPTIRNIIRSKKIDVETHSSRTMYHMSITKHFKNFDDGVMDSMTPQGNRLKGKILKHGTHYRGIEFKKDVNKIFGVIEDYWGIYNSVKDLAIGMSDSVCFTHEEVI